MDPIPTVPAQLQGHRWTKGQEDSPDTNLIRSVKDAAIDSSVWGLSEGVRSQKIILAAPSPWSNAQETPKHLARTIPNERSRRIPIFQKQPVVNWQCSTYNHNITLVMLEDIIYYNITKNSTCSRHTQVCGSQATLRRFRCTL